MTYLLDAYDDEFYERHLTMTTETGEPQARCSRCRELWPLSTLEDGLCPDCQTEDDDDD